MSQHDENNNELNNKNTAQQSFNHGSESEHHSYHHSSDGEHHHSQNHSADGEHHHSQNHSADGEHHHSQNHSADGEHHHSQNHSADGEHHHSQNRSADGEHHHSQNRSADGEHHHSQNHSVDGEHHHSHHHSSDSEHHSVDNSEHHHSQKRSNDSEHHSHHDSGHHHSHHHSRHSGEHGSRSDESRKDEKNGIRYSEIKIGEELTYELRQKIGRQLAKQERKWKKRKKTKQENRKSVTDEQKKKKKKKRIIISVFLALVICISSVFVVGKTQLNNNSQANRIEIPEGVSGEVEQDETGTVIYYNGEQYRYNEDVFCILLIGWENYRAEGEGIGYNGQADADYLCVLNTETNAITVVPVNRDTWIDVDVYSVGNQLVRTEKMQLSLAFAYGNGGDSSCQNVVKSVSRLFCNVSIPMYAALNADGIGAINDIVGGVTVPEYESKSGTKTGNMITLYGDEAVSYLKARDVEKVGSVSDRMARQMDYIRAFAKQMVSKTKEDLATPINIFNAVKKYVTTNIDVTQISYLGAKYLDSALDFDTKSIEGSYSVVDEHDVFTADGEAMLELVLELFYVKQ